ncbi:hypothetical protein ABIB25_001231 [Nakamurella sp. UYEF19]|uniref:hypothetical protein n=1 Tax=Nakamurella sp. UYEF19 TaxID=1756392 RepID=UPI0033979364
MLPDEVPASAVARRGWPGSTVALVVTVLPEGTWSPGLVNSYFHGERVAYLVLTVLVGMVAVLGALTMDDSRTADEHHEEQSA